MNKPDDGSGLPPAVLQKLNEIRSEDRRVRFRTGLLAGLGYNGRGVAMATMIGRMLAAWAGGTPGQALPFPTTALKAINLHDFAQLGARVAVRYLRLRDAMDR